MALIAAIVLSILTVEKVHRAWGSGATVASGLVLAITTAVIPGLACLVALLLYAAARRGHMAKVLAGGEDHIPLKMSDRVQ